MNLMIQRAPAQSLTFEPVEITGNVATLGAQGEDAKDFIGHQVNRFRDNWLALNNNYMGGLDSFAEDFLFASTAEAEPKYAEVAFKYAFKKIMGAVFKKLGGEEGPIPGVGEVYELTVGLMEELEKEHERVEKAELQVKARDYVKRYRDSMSAKFTTTMQGMEARKTGVLHEYNAVLKDAPPESRAKDLAKPHTSPEDQVRVAGPAAEYLNTLKATVDAFQQGVPKSTAECEFAFAEGWVMGSEGHVASKGGGNVYMDGRMRLDYHALLKDGQLTFDRYPSEASLAAKGADKMADVLMANIKNGRSIDQMQILKQLTIDVEDYVSWGFNNHFYIHIAYRSPDNIVNISTIPSPVRDAELLARAPDVEQQTLSSLDLAALSKAVTKIKAY
jgi:hypothetical protein